MKRVNEKWYECEDGHITAGDGDTKKCSAELWQLHYIKGKRKGQWKGESRKEDKPCGKPIVNSGDIPVVLDYFSVWDHRTMHAFLIGQKFDAEFIIGLQTIFKKIKDTADESTKNKGT